MGRRTRKANKAKRTANLYPSMSYTCFCRDKEKGRYVSHLPGITLLFYILMLFCRLDQYLHQNNFPCTSIHEGRNQGEREDALLAFKSGYCPILIATSVASRGIGIKNVMHVVNYDMAPVSMSVFIVLVVLLVLATLVLRPHFLMVRVPRLPRI